ncbi:hypothetical protein MtrunA17_Chr7g0214281 [Medicago truncatula]|uniref:Uncharacterized protein n=1 Tax=Medicago truncatula TaxID=3880 RepID=A0A396GSF4_MEDTR|nr:hypothetical protein MtrunA17_Chr7g0214281 [Medicago truncatula]
MKQVENTGEAETTVVVRLKAWSPQRFFFLQRGSPEPPHSVMKPPTRQPPPLLYFTLKIRD